MKQSKINKLARMQRVKHISGRLGARPVILNICNNLESPREYETELICGSLPSIQLYQTLD